MVSLRGSRGGLTPRSDRASRGRRKAEGGACVKIRVTCAATELVAEVGAVVRAVALEGAGDAGAVETRELIRSASGTTCNSDRSRSKTRHGRKSARRQRIATERMSPTHPFSLVSSDIGSHKEFFICRGLEPTSSGSAAEHPSR